MGGFVYLSGQISGLTYDAARFGWRATFGDWMEDGNTVLSPMRHEGHLAELKGTLEHSYPENLFSHPKMIVAKDFLDIQRSDIIVANFLSPTRVSIGTLVELGYAKALGKTIVVIMEKGNIHDHPFVREVADTIVESVSDAATVVNSLLSEGV